MKQIIFAAVVQPNDDSITLENLKEALKHLGSVYFPFSGEVDVQDPSALDGTIWVFKSDSDEEDEYHLVKGQGDWEGRLLTAEEMTSLRTSGVCATFYAEYPDAASNGAPLYAVRDDFAAISIGEHGFNIPPDGPTVLLEDRGDDGPANYWFKIAVPATLEQAIKSAQEANESDDSGDDQ